jgi:hypothetical protein
MGNPLQTREEETNDMDSREFLSESLSRFISATLRAQRVSVRLARVATAGAYLKVKILKNPRV